MVDVGTVFGMGFYKIPLHRIHQNRIEFYDLKRETGETIEQWLNRVQNSIIYCDLPANIIEFLLIDRFICGLNNTEMDVVRSAGTWSLKDLLARFADQRDITVQCMAGNVTLDESVISRENNLIGTTKSELVSDYSWSNIRLGNEMPQDKSIFHLMMPPRVTREDVFPLTDVHETPNNNGIPSTSGGTIDRNFDQAMPLHCEINSLASQDEYRFTVYEPICRLVEDENRFERPIGGAMSGNHFKRQPNTTKNRRSFTCGMCNESFSRRSELTDHFKEFHDGIRSFPCNQCEKSYTLLGNLNAHKKYVHCGVSYACERCEKRFISPAHLKAHSYTHSGERPYVCDQCNWSFNQSGRLKRHKMLIHQIKPQECL